MKIAINIRFWVAEPMDGFGNFVKEIVSIWITKYPEHQFVLITDNALHHISPIPHNVIIEKIGFPARLPFLWALWYNYFIPRILKRHKPDIFVSPDSMCSTRTNIPQLMTIHDLSYVHYPNLFPKNHIRFFKNHIPKMANKAKRVATVSQFSKNDLINCFQLNGAKIDVVYSAVKPKYTPLPFDEIQAVRAKYSNGLPYFLHIGTITPRKNIIMLLKAFSIFKSRQQSSLKLLLIGKVPSNNESFRTLLTNYKYASDVILIENATDSTLKNILGAAFALVYPSLYEGFGVPPLEAMQAGVPAIVANNSALPEICGNAACYVNASDVNDIYNGLREIYTNDSYKEQLVRNGFEQLKKYSWQNTADLLWESLLKTVHNII